MGFSSAFLLLTALSSFATSTTIRLEYADVNLRYFIQATMTPDAHDPTHGRIDAEISDHRKCHGKYSLDLDKNNLSIEFREPRGGGGCENHNLDVEVTLEKYQQLKQGHDVEVIFRSINFYWVRKVGKVSLVSNL